jgi:hypothetical protein
MRKMARIPRVWLGLVISTGCSGQMRQPTDCPSFVAPRARITANTTTEPVEIREYLPSDRSIEASVDLNPDAPDAKSGVLAMGVRIGTDGSVGEELTEPPLSSGVRLPAHLGGGFLFWNAHTLYHSPKMTGRLEPLSDVAEAEGLHHVSFGPNFSLLHHDSGSRHAFDPRTRRRASLPVKGLIDAATLGDGRSVLLVEPNRVLVRGAEDQQYSDRTADIPTATALESSFDSIRVVTRFEGLYRLESNGTFTHAEASPKKLGTRVRRLPGQQIIRQGVPLSDGRALVVDSGAFVRVDLHSKTVLGESKPLLAATDKCAILPAAADVLGLCWTSAENSVVVAGAASTAPQVERIFDGRVNFFAGATGTLAVDGPCDGRRKPGEVAVCTRDGQGQWHSLVVSATTLTNLNSTSNIGQPAPRLLRWIPTTDGGALGLVGGTYRGILDAKQRRFTQFTHDQGFLAIAFQADGSRILDDDFAIRQDGAITGYVMKEAKPNRALVTGVSITPDGQVETAPIGFVVMGHAGALGLGTESGRLWQSADYGQHWQPVSTPPGFALGGGATSIVCSRLGCDLGAWYRIGFPLTPPHVERFHRPRPAAIPAVSPDPQLVCTPLGAAKTRSVAVAFDSAGTQLDVLDFGARLVRLREDFEPNLIQFDVQFGSLKVLAATDMTRQDLLEPSAPYYRATVSQPSQVLFHQPFGPPTILHTRITWIDVRRASKAANQTVDPALGGNGDAIPVLSQRAGESAGILLHQLGWVAWLRDRHPTRIFALGAINESFFPLSAYAADDNTLLLYARDAEQVARIIEVTAKGSRIVRELPARPLPRLPTPDYLAVREDGKPAILRIPSVEPPTTDDPALVLMDDQPPIALAPWSTLQTASTCAADGSAVRAIVTMTPHWLEAVLPGRSGDRAAALGMVRWGKASVCLEAVEIPVGEIRLGENDIQLFVSGHLEGQASAHRYGLGLGGEYLEPLSCDLKSNR